MAPFTGAPSRSEQIALALAPKFAAVLSLLGSSYILYDVFRIRRTKPRSFHSFHRLLIGLSICDMLMSVGLFTSTWPMPVDTPYVWGAAGNTQTCAFVGFIEQAGVSAVLYNGSLSVNYMLRIRYGWQPGRIRRSAEPWLHGVPIVIGLGTMIAGIPLKLFNSGIFDCWIAPFPQGCQQSFRNGGESTCERGDNASLYQWLFDLVPKFGSIFLVTINMFLIYRGVLATEKKSFGRSASALDGKKKPDLARRLATQSYFYVGALYLTYIPVIITRITELTTGSVYYEMLLTISITIPLQGFWNAVVYLRPRWIQAREEKSSSGMTNRNWSFVQALSNAFQVFKEGAGDDEDDPNSQPQTAAVHGDAQNDNNRDGAAASFQLHFSSAEQPSQQHSEFAGEDPSSQHEFISPVEEKMAT